MPQLPVTARTLNDNDLAGYARRIAFGARQHLEATDPTWVYLPSFDEAVIAEATLILKSVVQHERQQAEYFIASVLV